MGKLNKIKNLNHEGNEVSRRKPLKALPLCSFVILCGEKRIFCVSRVWES